MKAYFLLLIVSLILTACGKRPEASLDHEDNALVAANLYARGANMTTNAVETRISFKHRIWVKFDQFPKREKRELKDVLLKKIRKQVDHLFGSMANSPTNKGVLKLGSNQSIQLDESSIKIDEKNVEVTADYSYQGGAIIDNGQLEKSIKFAIPRNPDLIYAQAQSGLSTNPCTDTYYNGEVDFWYFWHTKCGTLLEKTHYDNVNVNITQLSSTTSTYPEFSRLVRKDKSGNKKIIIFQFFGYPHETKSVQDELVGQELYTTHEKTKDFLKSSGFAAKSRQRLNSHTIFYVFEKYIPQSNLTIEMKIFYGNTGLKENNVTLFHQYYKQALEEASIIYYSGHSGFGATLDLQKIESSAGKINFNKNDYQVLFIDSCSSFSYYTEQYFAIKGTKNLDIITNGLSAYFRRANVGIKTLLQQLINPFETGRAETWQTIISKMHIQQVIANPELPGHLLTISGDEDNPTTAPKISINKANTIYKEAAMVSILNNGQILNLSSQNEDLNQKKDIIDGFVNADASVYLLTKKGSVFVSDRTTEDPDWSASSVNNAYTPFKFMTYLKSPDGQVTLYLLGTNNILYVKRNKEPVTKTSKQHPNGLGWIKLEYIDQKLVGTDENGESYRYSTRGSGAWLKN